MTEVILFFLLVSPAWAADQQKITINSNNWLHLDYPWTLKFNANEEPRLVDGRVLVPLRKLAEYFLFQVDYFPESKKIILADELGKTMELTLGQKQATANGRQVLLDVPAKAVGGVTFVPLRFIAENFDMEVGWQASTYTVSILNYAISTPKYILDMRSYSLLQRGEPGEAHHMIIKLAEQGISWDMVRMTVTTTALGHDIVAIRSCHGEPHLWNDTCYLYIANGQVVAQSLIKNSLMWDNRFTGISTNGSHVILNNGRTATVYDDRTLQVVAKYDLQALCAGIYADIPIANEYWYQDATYEIVGFGDNYLLLKGAYHLLDMVVYPESGHVDVVYKEILSAFEQEYFEQSYIDGPIGAGAIYFQFEGEKDGFLIFTANSSLWKDIEYNYRLRR